MAETPVIAVDPIKVIDGIADNCCDLETVAALREAQTALKRLARIKAEHHRHEKTTAGGTVVYPSIHGHIMHLLLYGNVNEL